MRAFENLVHEASHYNLFTSPRAHEILEFLYAFPVFRLLQDYRRSHQIHHKHLGDPTRDPDVIRIKEIGLDHLPDRFGWLLFGLPATGYLTYEYLTTTFAEFWTTASSKGSKIAYWTIVLAAVSATHAAAYFTLYYLVPLFIILPVTRYWAEASEHAALDLTGDFGNSRSNIGLAHLWFMHPHNDGYHAVHHLDARVPFHALPIAHEQLMQENAEFKAKAVVSRGFVQTFKQMRVMKMVIKDMTAVKPKSS
ncbi:hypothetical protein HDU89_007817 [Geranomyces variabilis]|nr:hypothetical protein HDU89_007817 [Geranomyces variabilis]